MKYKLKYLNLKKKIKKIGGGEDYNKNNLEKKIDGEDYNHNLLDELYKKDLINHNHNLYGFYNKNLNICLNLSDIKVNDKNKKYEIIFENEIYLLENQISISNNEILYIINETINFIKKYYGDYALSINDINNTPLIFYFYIEKSKINDIEKSKINDIEKSKINDIQKSKINDIEKSKINDIEKSKINDIQKGGKNYNINCNIESKLFDEKSWELKHASPEERAINRAIFKILIETIGLQKIKDNFDEIRSKYIYKYPSIKFSFYEFMLNIYSEIYAIIGKEPEFIIDKFKLIFSNFKDEFEDECINEDNILSLYCYKMFNSIMFSELEKKNKLHNPILRGSFFNIQFNKELIKKYFSKLEDFTSKIKNYYKKNEMAYLSETQNIMYNNMCIFGKKRVTNLSLLEILTDDEILSGKYKNKLELVHLLIEDNWIVHNGINNIEIIDKLLKLFNKNIIEYDNCGHEINFIHGYLHDCDKIICTDTFIDLEDLYYSKITDKYIKHCFEIYANCNRYKFLKHTIDSDGNLDEFNLENNNYIYSDLAKRERKVIQNGLSNSDKFRKINIDLSLNISESISKTKLFPLNDPYTINILSINHNIEKFQIIKDYFFCLKPKKKITLLLKENLNQYLMIIKKINPEISIDDILLYFKYNIEPERYNINWKY